MFLLFAGNKVKAGKSFVFWGLEKEIQSVAVVGLGKKEKSQDCLELICQEREAVRVAAAAGCRALISNDVTNIYLDSLEDAESTAEGALLSTFKFQDFKTKKKPLPKISLYTPTPEATPLFSRGLIKATSQNIARRLADTPSNHMTPTIFAKQVQELFKNSSVKVTVHDKKWGVDQKMGGFVGVAQGSCEEPKFVELSYEGAKTTPIVLVGKGVTFDSGGISIKPSSAMDEMRADMSGAAIVTATLHGLSTLNIPLHVKVLIPLVENMPSGNALKPGDVITAHNGKTICVDNTDAEGRLILADALSYSNTFKPRFVVDVATLTGAIRVALGGACTGVFSNSDQLYDKLQEASARSGDRVWRMPLWKHYTNQMKGRDGYDINNVGKGKGGGSCTAAGFLREFVPEGVDWMHLDVAGVMGPKDDTPYLGVGMTGRPTRTLIEFLEQESC